MEEGHFLRHLRSRQRIEGVKNDHHSQERHRPIFGKMHPDLRRLEDVTHIRNPRSGCRVFQKVPFFLQRVHRSSPRSPLVRAYA